jgi:serine/threonine protein kinase
MFNAGSQIGQYTLVRKLGKGGFGEVWLAEKSSQFFTKRVAIKLPHDEQIDFETIRREATLWEEASGHPNVLPIIDADVYDGQVVIVSEYAEGGSLADKLKSRGRFSPQQAIEMIIGILNGLDFLHNKKIIHRDIKPQNVLLQGDTPRLADFGISRAMHTSTISSVVIGTDAYMSPEAFDGKRNVQTDIWSVGVVLYQLLKGSLPFPQEHPSERMYAVLTKQFEPLPEEVPAELRRILQRALAKNPDERYQSAAEMREELRLFTANFLSQPNRANQTPVVLPSVQPNVPPNNFVSREIGNQSIVTRFSVTPISAELPAANPTNTQTFVKKNQPSSVKKAIIASAASVVLTLLLIAGIVAGLLSMSRKSPTPLSGGLSNTANTSDYGSTSNQDVTEHSTSGNNSTTNSLNGSENPTSNMNSAVVTSNANTIYSSNTTTTETRSSENYNSGKTTDLGYSDSTKTSNPNSSNKSRTSNPDYTESIRLESVDPDANFEETDPTSRTSHPTNTMVITTRKPDGKKTTTRTVTRDGEMPPEIRREFEKILRQNPNPSNANLRRP